MPKKIIFFKWRGNYNLSKNRHPKFEKAQVPTFKALNNIIPYLRPFQISPEPSILTWVPFLSTRIETVYFIFKT